MKAKFKNLKNPFWYKTTKGKNGNETVITKCKYRLKIDHFESLDSHDFKEFEVVGTAICHPDDEFSKETGRRIADSRAKKLAYRNVIDQLDSKRNLLKKQLIELEHGIAKHKRLLHDEQEHYKKLIDETNK